MGKREGVKDTKIENDLDMEKHKRNMKMDRVLTEKRKEENGTAMTTSNEKGNLNLDILNESAVKISCQDGSKQASPGQDEVLIPSTDKELGERKEERNKDVQLVSDKKERKRNCNQLHCADRDQDNKGVKLATNKTQSDLDSANLTGKELSSKVETKL